MQSVDFAILCALNDEFEAVRTKFAGTRSSAASVECDFALLQNRVDGRTYRIAILNAGRMGNLDSLAVSSAVIRDLSPHHIILTGICGGIIGAKEDFRLGDVVVSNSVVYYEPAKVVSDSIEPRHRRYPTESSTGDLMETALLIADGGWTAQDEIGIERPSDSNARVRPRLKHGAVCSGEKVIARGELAAKLLKMHPDAVSIEMEAAGVSRACEGTAASFLIVKAVSDYADEEKNDGYRAYACATAASFVKSLLADSRLPELPERTDGQAALGDLFRFTPNTDVEIVLPSYKNPRHEDSTTLNFPYNPWESAYDDVYSALRLVAPLEAFCGRGHVRVRFDHDQDSGSQRAPNEILIGSSASNVRTYEQLTRDVYFSFATEGGDYEIVGPRDERYCPVYRSMGDRRTLVEDYALISCFKVEDRATTIVAGCHAYGQLALGDYLSDPAAVDRLLRHVWGRDFQCILRLSVSGRTYAVADVASCVVCQPNRGAKWSKVL